MPMKSRVRKSKTQRIVTKRNQCRHAKLSLKQGKYEVTIITDSGEEVKSVIARKHRMFKIGENQGERYTCAKILEKPKINARVALYGENGATYGRIKKMVAIDPSIDVEPGDIPPRSAPGGH